MQSVQALSSITVKQQSEMVAAPLSYPQPTTFASSSHTPFPTISILASQLSRISLAEYARGWNVSSSLQAQESNGSHWVGALDGVVFQRINFHLHLLTKVFQTWVGRNPLDRPKQLQGGKISKFYNFSLDLNYLIEKATNLSLKAIKVTVELYWTNISWILELVLILVLYDQKYEKVEIRAWYGETHWSSGKQQSPKSKPQAGTFRWPLHIPFPIAVTVSPLLHNPWSPYNLDSDDSTGAWLIQDANSSFSGPSVPNGIPYPEIIPTTTFSDKSVSLTDCLLFVLHPIRLSVRQSKPNKSGKRKIG